MRAWRGSGDQSGPGGRRRGPALVTGRQPGAGQRPEIRRLTQDDDLAPVLDLARRSFGPFGAEAAAARLADTREAVADGRHLGAFDGGRPMAGVASVTVAPEARGQGAGRALMTALAGQIAARGYPLSALYPATAAVYRAVGYELAGAQYQASVPARSLRSLLPPDVAAAGRPDGRVGLRRAGRLRSRHLRPAAGRRALVLLPGAGRLPRLPLAGRQQRGPGVLRDGGLRRDGPRAVVGGGLAQLDGRHRPRLLRPG